MLSGPLGIAEFEHFAEQSLPALEKHVKREENIITAYQKWIERFRYLLGTVPRQRFGRNFAEYEHDDGGHYGGKHVRERFVADDERHEQHGRYRGERYVDDVVAYRLCSWSGHRRGQSTQRYGNAFCRSYPVSYTHLFLAKI